MGHQPDHLARGEVIARLLIRLLVEAHDEVLEEVAHLDVADPVRVQVDPGHRLDDGIEAVARIELLDLVAELELLEDAPCRVGEAVDVGDEIGRDVLAVAQQLLESVGADVVEGLLAALPDHAGQQAGNGVFRGTGGDQARVFGQHRILGRLQHAIEAAQHDHRQHDQPVLRRAVRPAQAVGDLPDFATNFLMAIS